MRTIAWDVDDVLNDLMRIWLETAWRSRRPECVTAYTGLRTNPPLHELGAAEEEYIESLDAFRQERYLASVAPSEKALAWFERNGARYRHIALTAVPLTGAPISAHWVVRHFGKWIRSFHFVPSRRTGESIPCFDNTKSDFLEWLGKDDTVLVDDSRENVDAARALGLQAFLYPRPWNGAAEDPGNIFKALECL